MTSFEDNGGKKRRHSHQAIGIFLMLIIASLLAGYTVYHRLVENEQKQTRQTLNHIADIQAAAISSWVLERLADASVFGGGKFLGETIHAWIARGEPDDETRQQMLDQLEAVRSTFNYRDVSILDINGNVRIATEGLNQPLDPIAQKTVDTAISFDTTEVSSIHSLDNGNGSPLRVVDIATPLLSIHERNAKVPSILLLRANASMHLEPFVQSMRLLSSSAEIYLAEIREGQVIVEATGGNSIHFREGEILPITLKQLSTSNQDHLSIFQVFGKKAVTVSVARRIEGVPWFLIAMIDRNASVTAAQQLAWIIAGIGAAVLSLFGIAILLWWRERESDFRLQTLHAETEKTLLQRQYDYVARYANDMIILANADSRVIEVNDRTLNVLGRAREEVVGAQLNHVFQPGCGPIIEKALETLRHEGVATFELDQSDEKGSIVSIEASARDIELGSERFIQVICRDITERRRSEAALRESEDRMNGILTSILDVVWSFSPDLEKMNYINQSVARVYGYPPSAFLARPQLWLEMIHPDDREKVQHTLHGLNAEHPFCDAEYRIIHRDGSLRWLHCRGTLVVDRRGKGIRIDGVSSDISARKSAEIQVQMLAYYDNVTMLPNRSLLQDRLAQAMHMAQRSQKKVALLFMDLDNFKNINDSLGHHVGDMLLRAIAERLLQCVRDEDTVARIGGDEFLVVLPNIEKGEQTVAVAEKILAATAQAYTLQGQQIHTTISIGISVYPDDAQEPHELIRHADSALYQAKNHGRDNYQFFTQELNSQIMRSSSIERQLREAIDAGELSLWYQPQLDARRGELTGAEALLRWRRGESSFLQPVEFIPVAEERGLIARIGEWALREACAQSCRWQQQGLHPVRIAVNVSPLQFQQKGFAELVIEILNETGLDPACLELEITESAIMRRAPQVAELARRLRQVGVGISIDDFGTGYSSLSYLKQIPLDKIKIDRSFITDMLNDADDDAITFAIVNLAHSLKLRVIAEGVETHGQMERLRAFGCDEVQGHYYSSAVSAEDFATILAGERRFQEPVAAAHPV